MPDSHSAFLIGRLTPISSWCSRAKTQRFTLKYKSWSSPAAVASFLVAPVLYFVNYTCVTRLIEDPTLRPGVGLRAWAAVGIICMLGATGLFLYLQIRG